MAYVEDGDLLLLTIGEGRAAATEHVVDCIYLCIEPEMSLVVGLTVIGFVSDLLANNKLAEKLLLDWLRELKVRGGSQQWNGAEAQKFQPLLEALIACYPRELRPIQ